MESIVISQVVTMGTVLEYEIRGNKRCAEGREGWSLDLLVDAGGVTTVDGVIVTTTLLGMLIVRAMVVVDTGRPEAEVY